MSEKEKTAVEETWPATREDSRETGSDYYQNSKKSDCIKLVNMSMSNLQQIYLQAIYQERLSEWSFSEEGRNRNGALWIPDLFWVTVIL